MKTVRNLTVVAAVALLAGCATSSELDAVKAELAQVRQTAEAAKAQSAQAEQTANMANAKIDRAFKRAAQK